MKKEMCLLMACVMLLGLCACGQKPAEPESADWTRQGYFWDENGVPYEQFKPESMIEIKPLGQFRQLQHPAILF